MTAATSSAAAPSWVADRYGITVADVSSPVGRTMRDLTRIGLRRNPKRAQLLVSTVLGKHLPVDPRVAADAGRLLGAQVARCLAGDSSADLLTLGFAETATSLGHLVADELGSAYLHSTRRPDGPVPVAAGFEESHSHATDHLLRPGPAVTLFGDGPLVLVDDELSTGRTALNVISAVHARRPRERYVLAGLVDVRSPSADAARQRLADRLGCRIDVVSLVRGSVRVPDGTAERVARDLAGSVPPPAAPAEPVVRAVPLPWPASVPHGGRHGFAATDRHGFDGAVDGATEVLAGVIARSGGDAGRVLVLGTEELMYLPLRLALALRSPTRATAFQSTTRSPVHAIDAPGYPIRRRIDFTSLVHQGSVKEATRHVYNVRWPAGAAGEDQEADLIVVVDDGHAVAGDGGVAAAVARATGVPVVLARLTAVTR